MAQVEINSIDKSFGNVEVINGLDLEIPDGSFCVFVGPSGCGKSTLLRMISGLEDVTAGSIQIGGKEMIDVAPAKRGVAMVFQSYALYPHMSVAENITFGLRMKNVDRHEISVKLEKASKMLKLDSLLDRKPSQLSGGQKQRVAIGRAIVREPEVFLFDEPLSNLDASLRVEMRSEIIRLHSELKVTMIYVTHDQVEAMTMADMIVVMNAGRIEQVGSPLELYHNPKTLFVARFMGSPQMNSLEVELKGSNENKTTCILPGGNPIVLENTNLKSGHGILGFRPEHLSIEKSGEFSGRVVLAEKLGPETLLHVDIDHEAPLIVKADGLTMIEVGQTCSLKINEKACHVFSEDGSLLRSGSLIA